MNIECLIEVLKEKGYVKQTGVMTLGNKKCVTKVETRYQVVMDKILEVDNNIDNIDTWVRQIHKYGVEIVDLKVLKEWLEENCTDERNVINALNNDYDDCVTLRDNHVMEEAINYHIKGYVASFGSTTNEIINVKVENERIKAEKEEEKKVVDFINSLP